MIPIWIPVQIRLRFQSDYPFHILCRSPFLGKPTPQVFFSVLVKFVILPPPRLSRALNRIRTTESSLDKGVSPFSALSPVFYGRKESKPLQQGVYLSQKVPKIYPFLAPREKVVSCPKNTTGTQGNPPIHVFTFSFQS